MSDITFTNTSFNGASPSLSWSHNIGVSDDYLIVGIYLEDATNTIDGCTLNGTALTLGVGAKNSALSAAIYHTNSLPVPGNSTIVISTAEHAAGVIANAISGYSFAQQGPQATAVGSVAGSTTVRTSLTTSINGTLVFDAVAAAYMGAEFSVDSGQTLEFDLDNRSGLSAGMSYEETVTAGVSSLGWTSTLSHTHLVQVAASFEPSEEGGGTPVTSVSQSIPYPIYGITIDDISSLGLITEAIGSLTHTPVTRIVFDEDQAPSVYNNAVNQIGSESYIMGELLDSSALSSYHVSSYSARVSSYLAYFGDRIDIWEVANEINGEWTGTASDSAAKMIDAYDQVKALGYRAAVTFYYNEDCETYSWEEMWTWIDNHVPSRMYQNLDYCLLSWWEDDCNSLEKTDAEWGAVYSSLSNLFPNAKVGFSEVGTEGNDTKRAEFMEKFYELSINLNSYIGGYFWWYWREDAVPRTLDLWTTYENITSALPAPAVDADPPTGGSGEITYDSDGESGAANVTTHSISGITVPTESDRLLVVHLGLEDKSATGLTISSITFDGVAGTLAISQSESTSDEIQSLIYYWLDADLPASGTATLSVTMSAEIRTISMNYTFVYGAAQQAPEATGTDSAASDTSVNPSLTTLTDNAFVFSNVIASTGTPSFSPGSSQTERFEYSGASSHAGGDKEVTTAGSTSNTWTASSSDNLAACSAAFAPEAVTEPGTDYYGTNARSAVGDASGDEATFTFTITREASKIDVFAQWPTGNYASDTPFTITAPGTGNTLAVDVDQSARGGQVNYIGGINGRIPAGDITVVIDDDANGTVVADMVRLEVTYAAPPKSDIEIYDTIAPERQYMRRLVD